MKTGFFSKIAADNIKKYPRLYVPRILAEAGLLCCFYIVFALACDERLAAVRGGSYVVIFMEFGAAVLGALSLVLILYVNSFLMKQRKADYGLYNVLGMEKRHIVRVLFSESVFTVLFSVIPGLGLGILFYKLCSLLICKILQTSVIAGFYYINAKTIIIPLLIFLCFDLLAYFVNAVSVRRLKPVELMAERHTGEREPKIKWVLFAFGALTLGAGYFIALTVKNGIQAFALFFPAVILVIIGTYFLYVAGTTFVLKSLKRNKSFYYDKRHMPAVAGLLFRMKKNAVGLASVAILATGILVTISTTVSLYSAMQNMLDSRYPKHLYLSAYCETEEGDAPISGSELTEIVKQSGEECKLKISSVVTEKYLTVSYLLRGDSLLTKGEVTDDWSMGDITNVTFITEDTYYGLMNTKLITDRRDFGLEKDEIAVCYITLNEDGTEDDRTELTIGGRKYRIKETMDYFPIKEQGGGVKSIGIIVADSDVLNDIYLAQKEGYGKNASEFADRIAVTFTDEEAAEAVGKELEEAILNRLHADYESLGSATLDTKWKAKANLLGMYGSFLFLGIIVGIVCMFSTILIIYYKQISEGYEDRERFVIMRKIGMEQQEVRRTIKSQMTLQFFLPLVTAGIHTAVAFPMLLKLQTLLLLPNTLPAIICAVITFAVFAALYTAVYLLTSRTYYKIVR